MFLFSTFQSLPKIKISGDFSFFEKSSKIAAKTLNIPLRMSPFLRPNFSAITLKIDFFVWEKFENYKNTVLKMHPKSLR